MEILLKIFSPIAVRGVCVRRRTKQALLIFFQFFLVLHLKCLHLLFSTIGRTLARIIEAAMVSE